MSFKSFHPVLYDVARQYPATLVDEQVFDIKRIAFNISIAVRAAVSSPVNELEICDLGGGVGLFSVGCAALGFKRSVLVDDFEDSINHQLGTSVLDLHRSYGVEIISRDVVQSGIEDIEGPFDIITSFDSMEHWHNSPKRLFESVFNKLRPNGVFVLGVPNCVNLRKRISVPFGIGKWSDMDSWYEADRFRGHVREPDTNDLLYIGRDMKLIDLKIYGTNWLGYGSRFRLVRLATLFLDYPLRLRPSLCSDIYLVGRKPS
jgi:SAM-dependent methyltransferase